MAQKTLRTPDVNIVRNETKFSEGHLTSVRVLCMGHCWLETGERQHDNIMVGMWP